MISLVRPSSERLAEFLKAQSALPFSYSETGCTRGPAPRGYVVDRSRIQVGQGASAFAAARQALAAWSQFRLGWLAPYPDDVPLEAGRCIAVLARIGPLWWANACRIVYVVDEDDARVRRQGFAYGTLPGHAESGEERFLIEWDHESDQVWFEILAYSRPRHPLARLGYPFVRRLQKRFGREATSAFLHTTCEIGSKSVKE